MSETITPRRKGVDILILANTGTPEAPSYEEVAGQRGVELQEALTTMATTGKDSDGNETFLPGLYNAKLSLSGAYCPSDVAYQALKDAIRGKETILIQKKDGSDIEEAIGIVTANNISGPHDAEATYAMEIQISGGWTPSA